MSRYDLLYLFSYLTTASLLFPVGVGVWSWARLSPSLRVLTLGLDGYLVILILSIMASHQKWDIGQTFGYWASMIYGLTFTTVYALAMPPGLKRGLVIALGAAGVGYELLDLFFISGFDSLNGFSIPIMTLILVVSTLIFLYFLIRYPTESTLMALPLFWVAGAKLLSGLSNGLLDVFEPQLAVYSQQLLIYLILLTYVILMVCNILYGIGIWKERMRNTRSLR